MELSGGIRITTREVFVSHADAALTPRAQGDRNRAATPGALRSACRNPKLGHDDQSAVAVLRRAVAWFTGPARHTHRKAAPSRLHHYNH